MDIFTMAQNISDPWSREHTDDTIRGYRFADNQRHNPQYAKFAGVPSHPKLERIIHNVGAHIFHDAEIEAPHYSPNENVIFVPFPETFLSGEFYAYTLTHELSHWTGLNGVDRRDAMPTIMADILGDMTAIAREELTAELAVYLSADLLGLAQDMRGHSLHYIRAWLDNIADPRNIGDRDPRRAFNLALPNARRIVEFYRSKLA